jgi:hypothetical protein
VRRRSPVSHRPSTIRERRGPAAPSAGRTRDSR